MSAESRAINIMIIIAVFVSLLAAQDSMLSANAVRPSLGGPLASPSGKDPSAGQASGRTIEDEFLDWVRLNEEGGRTVQTPVYMRLFAISKTNLGTGGEGGKESRVAEAKMLQAQGPVLLREAFLSKARALGLNARGHDDRPLTELPDTAIVIEGEFVKIDPGSRAKRHWLGFGAGKSSIEIAGRIVTPTGSLLAEFRHRRIGVMGVYGGDSVGKLLSDTRSNGEDLAEFVGAWLTDKLPRR
ncbi:MAG: DUF4410 domain-containing protein [Luteitalea sp.]|nr:DUF4410 domain-containing protein [Luteitalea sp.]